MNEDNMWLWIGLCLVGSFCAYSWYWYVRSIIFYRRNGFDFSKDFGPNYFSRDEGHQFLASPKAKFYFGMPFVLAVTSLLSILTLSMLLGIIKRCVECGGDGFPI